MCHTKKHVVAEQRAYLEGDAESDKKSAGIPPHTHTRTHTPDMISLIQ